MSKFRLDCRRLEEPASQIYARHPAQLDTRFDTAVGVGHHRHSDSPLRPRPNSVILSSVLAALLYAASSEDHRTSRNREKDRDAFARPVFGRFSRLVLRGHRLRFRRLGPECPVCPR